MGDLGRTIASESRSCYALGQEKRNNSGSVLGYIGKTRLCSGPLKKSGAFVSRVQVVQVQHIL